MNSSFKSLLWLMAACAALYFGVRFQKERELEQAQKDYNEVTARATDISREIASLKEKLQNATSEGGTAEAFEAAHNASLAAIVDEQKRIETLMAKWPEVEADRVAAVQAVREKVATLPPATLTLSDGSKLEQYVIKSVSKEEMVSVEHSSGLVKLGADKLPEELKEKLGLGWASQPPPTISIDRDGNAVVKQALSVGLAKDAAAQAAKDVEFVEKDSTTVGGVTRALAATETMLAEAEKKFEAERVFIRTLSIFKADVKDPKTGRPYGIVKKEANARLSSLAVRVTALRKQRSELQYKLKTF